jgi:hypothetical protein
MESLDTVCSGWDFLASYYRGVNRVNQNLSSVESLMPKFQRSHGPHKSDHGIECEILKLRILAQADSLRGCAAKIRKQKGLLKHFQSLYQISKSHQDKAKIENTQLTLDRLVSIHQMQVKEQVKMKAEYTKLYQKVYK